MASGKKCFVIAPIGSEESETRKRSDQVLKYIIKPVAEECGYEAVRADEISEPGIITTQVIQRLIDDDLVIADLTGRNPNVFYELAIRHAIRKPVVQIIKRDERIPFDVAVQRTIQYDLDLESAAACKEELIKQIRAAEKKPDIADSPVATAIDMRVLRESDNPVEKSIVEIVPMLEDIRSIVQGIDFQSQGSGRIPRKLLLELAEFNNYALSRMSPDGTDFFFYYVRYFKRIIDILELFASENQQSLIHELRAIQRKAFEQRDWMMMKQEKESEGE